jgi:hypothetical protein
VNEILVILPQLVLLLYLGAFGFPISNVTFLILIQDSIACALVPARIEDGKFIGNDEDDGHDIYYTAITVTKMQMSHFNEMQNSM